MSKKKAPPKPRHIEGFKVNEQVLVPVNVHLFICVDHDGFNEARSHRASVVVARDINHARDILDKALIGMGLKPFAQYRYNLREIPLNRWQAEILADGSY